MTPNDPTLPTMAAVGELVRQLRLDGGMSIGALATAAGLSPGLLSQIERGMGNPSFTTLIKLADALGVTVGRFFVGGSLGGEVVRKGAHPRLLLAEENLVYELITPRMNGSFGVIRAQFVPGWSNEDAVFTHEGEECILIVQGELLVSVGGVRHLLREGDSMTYDPSLPHWYRNDTDEDTVLIATMSPTPF